MSKDDNGEKCFGAKHFSPDEPDDTWGLEQLGEHARQQHEIIVKGERALAPAYWQLGCALQIAKRQLGRSHWGKFLAAHGIHRVRACRARAIFRSHPTPEAVAELTVEEAYEARVTRQVHRRAKDKSTVQDDQSGPRLPGERTEAGLQAYLVNVQRGADEFVDVAAFLERDRRAALFQAYRAALERLQFLGRMLGAEEGTGVRNGTATALRIEGNPEKT
jgi:hypothetical protein